MAKPSAVKVHESRSSTVWLVRWPSTMRKQGKAYYATTYPDSDLVFVETAAKRRPVSRIVGSKITPVIVAAIGSRIAQIGSTG